MRSAVSPGLKPNILIESRAPSNLLALAEAGHGVAIIPSVVLTHRHTLRIVRITYQRKPIRTHWPSCGTSGAFFRVMPKTFASHLLHICASSPRSRSCRRRMWTVQ